MQVPLAFLYTVNLSVAQDQNIKRPSVPVSDLSRGSSETQYDTSRTCHFMFFKFFQWD